MVALVSALGWWFSPVEPAAAVAMPATPAAPLPSAITPGAAVTAASAVPKPAPETALGARDIQVCGGGRLRVAADGTLDYAQLERAFDLPAARERILAAMRTDSSDISRASQLVLAMISADDERRTTFLGFLFDCGTPECRGAPQAVKDANDARDALARMASTSADPKVYALAFNICGKRAGGACGQLNAAQWARLDNSNAQPWIHLLFEAQERRDGAAEQEALHRIATARRSDGGYFDLAGRIVSAAPDDESALAASYQMASSALGVSAAWFVPYQTLTRACKGEALDDANRVQACAAVAETMVERSDTAMTQLIGVAIGRRVGLTDERSDRIRAEYSGYTTSTFERISDADRYGCAGMRREVENIRRRAALTETGAIRQWAGEPGRDLGALIVKERELRIVRDAQEAARIAAAASGASAPPGTAR